MTILERLDAASKSGGLDPLASDAANAIRNLILSGRVLADEAQSFVNVGYAHHTEDADLQLAIDGWKQLLEAMDGPVRHST